MIQKRMVFIIVLPQQASPNEPKAEAIMSMPARAALAIEHLYDDHHTWLRSWLQRRLGNRDDAAELAHDVFLRLILKPALPRLDTHGEARAYLHTIARGLCINLWQHREIERVWLDTLAACPPEYAPSPERQVMTLQALQEIAAMLRELSPKAAGAFLMVCVGQMDSQEVAAELRVSSRMVRKYVAQGMLRCLQLQARQTLDGLLEPGLA